MSSAIWRTKRQPWTEGGAIAPVAALCILALLLGLPRGVAAYSPWQGAVFSAGVLPIETPPTPSPAAPAKGKFLVASRRLGDANFAETVVLLIEYNQKGALGVVINRPADEQLSTLLPNVEGLRHRADPIFLGGPVGRNQLLILARSPSQPEESLPVFEDVYTIAGQTVLERLIHEVGANAKFRAFVGYAGWGAGQLDFEMSQGGWHVVPADTATVFDKPPSEIWPDLIRRGEAQWVLRQSPEPLLILSINPKEETHGKKINREFRRHLEHAGR